jgi:hypothetical protein
MSRTFNHFISLQTKVIWTFTGKSSIQLMFTNSFAILRNVFCKTLEINKMLKNTSSCNSFILSLLPLQLVHVCICCTEKSIPKQFSTHLWLDFSKLEKLHLIPHGIFRLASNYFYSLQYNLFCIQLSPSF